MARAAQEGGEPILADVMKHLQEQQKKPTRMKKDLVNLQPVLAQAAKETSKLLKEVSLDQAAADEVKQRVMKEEEAVNVIAAEARAIAADAQRDLDEAMPAYHAAVRSPFGSASSFWPRGSAENRLVASRSSIFCPI